MAEEGKKDPTTGTETDISKSQSQQQPPNQASQQQDGTGQQSGQFETGQDDKQPFGKDGSRGTAEEGSQGDTLAQQRTDVEGLSPPSEPAGEAESGFVGSQSQQDTSSELVEEEDEDERKSDGE